MEPSVLRKNLNYTDDDANILRRYSLNNLNSLILKSKVKNVYLLLFSFLLKKKINSLSVTVYLNYTDNVNNCTLHFYLSNISKITFTFTFHYHYVSPSKLIVYSPKYFQNLI